MAKVEWETDKTAELKTSDKTKIVVKRSGIVGKGAKMLLLSKMYEKDGEWKYSDQKITIPLENKQALIDILKDM